MKKWVGEASDFSISINGGCSTSHVELNTSPIIVFKAVWSHDGLLTLCKVPVVSEYAHYLQIPSYLVGRLQIVKSQSSSYWNT